MSSAEPERNSTASVTWIVEASDLADAISSDDQDDFPRVFATSRLVALMEIASARLLQPCLLQGQMSVGVRMDVTHSAPTCEGDFVTAKAKFVGKKGKFFVFEVVVEDVLGEVGRARHERAIVDPQRLEHAAASRMLTWVDSQPGFGCLNA